MQETQEMQVQFLGLDDPLQEEVATCFSIFAWKIPGQRSLEGYNGATKSQTQLSTHAHARARTHTHTHTYTGTMSCQISISE